MNIMAQSDEVRQLVDLDRFAVLLKETPVPKRLLIDRFGVGRQEDTDVVLQTVRFGGGDFDAEMKMRRHQTISDRLDRWRYQPFVLLKEEPVVPLFFEHGLPVI